MSKAKVVRLGEHSPSSAQRAAQIEECLNNFAAIIPLMDRELDDEGVNPAIMAYLITDLDRNFRLLDSLLQVRSTTVAQ